MKKKIFFSSVDCKKKTKVLFENILFMEIVPIFGGLLATGFLLDRQLRIQKEAMDPVDDFDVNKPNDANIPTISATTVNRDVSQSDPNEKIEIVDQVFRNREDALFHNVPALPSGNRPFQPTLRKHKWMPKHETVDYREPEIGNVRLTTKPTDVRVSDVLKRYEPNRKDFQDANGNIISTHATGVDRIIPSSEQEGYLLSSYRRKEWQERYNPNTIRKTQVNGKQMGVSQMVFGGKQLPSMNCGMAWDSTRKNVAVTRIPQMSSQVQHDTMGNRSQFSEHRLGKDSTVQGRTPMVKGMGRPTRPYVADNNISQKEDKVQPGRQPGIHNSIYNEPNNAHRSEQSSVRRKIDSMDVPSFSIARLPSSWMRAASTMKGKDTSARDKEMDYPHQRIPTQPIKRGIAPAGMNTRAGKSTAPPGYHEVFTDYLWDRSTKPYKRGAPIDKIGQSEGLHQTTNLSYEQGLSARRC